MVWGIITVAIYLSAIAWLIVSKIVERAIKKNHSFIVDVVIFACLFIIAVVIVITWLF
jgi:hypothetical protein